MAIKVALAGLLLACLAGCVSPEELRRADEARCRGFGFKPDTADFSACLQRESLARRYGSTWQGPVPFGWYGPGWNGPPSALMF
ncbi:MAG TPA: hypothetical protein VET85_08760 [Stellaceae bacterium]|nr:hypothetical protein [Stellaceae bacterium]